MIILYILDENKNPVGLTGDIHEQVIKWGEWMSDSPERKDGVARTELFNNTIMVSTVFLGLDHGMGFIFGTPQLFETMVFGLKDIKSQYTRRYSTWAEAVKGHEEIVAQVSGLKNPNISLA